MSLKTLQSKGYAILTTYQVDLKTKEPIECFLTEDEYFASQKVMQNPNAKFLIFDDGSIALSDIRRIEIVPQIAESSHMLENKNEIPELTEEERQRNIEKIAKIRADLSNRLRSK